MGTKRALPGGHPFLRSGVTRRTFLETASALAFATALPAGAFGQEGGSGFPQEGAPPDFPAFIPVYRETYLNWCGELRVPDAWTAAPGTPEDVAALVNWAADHGWRVRPKGMSHGWSPLLLPSGRPLAPCLLVDATRRLNQVWVGGPDQARTVTAQAGILLDDLWEALGREGLALATTPAPGNLTLGGALAIGGHGTVLDTSGGPPSPGWTYGSMSNAVLSLDAVVWDPGARKYQVRTFHRGDPAIGPLLVHAGRAFITAATLQAGPDVNLRCRSYTDIPAAEVFAPAGVAGPRCLQAWAALAGRVECTWFPGSDCPWLRVWSAAPLRPDCSRTLDGPYPFTFANWMSREDSNDLAAWLRKNPEKTPPFLELEMAVSRAGLAITGTSDVWGPSRFTTLHVKPSTLRYHVSGHAILCRAGDIQRVVSEFHAAFTRLLAAYADGGIHPVNGPLDFRISGLDRTSEVGVEGAREALLSPLRPRADHPQWDCAVWTEVLTVPGTAGAAPFYADLEAWILRNYQGDYASVRVEWAKGWGYSPKGPWTSGEVLSKHVPASFTTGYAPEEGWSATSRALRDLDPRGVFGNVFLDGLFKP